VCLRWALDQNAQQNHFNFWVKYILRLNFCSVNWLSKNLSQKVKSHNDLLLDRSIKVSAAVGLCGRAAAEMSGCAARRFTCHSAAVTATHPRTSITLSHTKTHTDTSCFTQNCQNRELKEDEKTTIPGTYGTTILHFWIKHDQLFWVAFSSLTKSGDNIQRIWPMLSVTPH